MKKRELDEMETLAVERLNKIWNEKKRALDLTQERVSLMCGWSGQSAFSQYLHARVPLNFEAVLRLSKVLRVHPTKIMPEIAPLLPKAEAEFEPGPELPDQFRKLPVVGVAQLGPDGFWLDQHDHNAKGDGYIEYLSRDINAYVLRVKGDSMSPTIRSGWLVVVEWARGLFAGYEERFTAQGSAFVSGS
jgi:phage repressor protein C with HTH and peptisase S24 domain